MPKRFTSAGAGRIAVFALWLTFPAVAAGGSGQSRGALSPAVPLSMSFETKAVVISGVTASGKVVLFGVAREASRTHPAYQQTVRRAEVLTDASGTGVVRFDLGEPVPGIAIWAAIDLASGERVAMPTPGYEAATILPVTPDLVKNDNAGQLKKLEWPAAELEAVLVRPGEGAWRLYASKYSGLDENAANQQPLRIDVKTMIPIGDSPVPPNNFRPRDVLLLIDPRWMQYAVVEVGR
jgi:hypothetical protein